MAKDLIDELERRRNFLRIAAAGGAAALAAFLQGCAPDIREEAETTTPAGTPKPAAAVTVKATDTAATSAAADATAVHTPQKPTETAVAPTGTPVEMENDGIARIAFVKTRDRAEGVRKAVELLGINPVEGKSVFLKPNFNSGDPAPGSTHPDVLAALVTAIKAMGAQRITVGDRSGMGNTRQVMEQAGVFRMAESLGFDTVVFDELSEDGWVKIEPEDSHWSRGFAIARPVADADAVVQACCLKTHRFGGHFTLSLKNSVGLVAKRVPGDGYNYMDELHSSPDQRRMIAEINAAYDPALIVMDGIEALISGGPDVGEKVAPEVVLAGTDRVAIDAVGVALLRCFGCKTEAGQGKIFDQEQIARAVALGIGVDSPAKIELVTADPESKAYSEQIKEILLAG